MPHNACCRFSFESPSPSAGGLLSSAKEVERGMSCSTGDAFRFAVRVCAAFDEFGGDFAEANGERRGLEDIGVGAPTANPPFYFFKAAQAHTQVRSAARKFPHGLRRMPLPAPQLVRGPSIELDDDFILPVTFHHTEAGAEILIGIEQGGFFKPAIGQDRCADAAQGEGADIQSFTGGTKKELVGNFLTLLGDALADCRAVRWLSTVILGTIIYFDLNALSLALKATKLGSRHFLCASSAECVCC